MRTKMIFIILVTLTSVSSAFSSDIKSELGLGDCNELVEVGNECLAATTGFSIEYKIFNHNDGICWANYQRLTKWSLIRSTLKECEDLIPALKAIITTEHYRGEDF